MSAQRKRRSCARYEPGTFAILDDSPDDQPPERSSPARRPRYHRFPSHVTEELEKYYTQGYYNNLSASEWNAIADELNLEVQQVKVWFRNRRQKEKNQMNQSMTPVKDEATDAKPQVQYVDPAQGIARVQAKEWEKYLQELDEEYKYTPSCWTELPLKPQNLPKDPYIFAGLQPEAPYSIAPMVDEVPITFVGKVVPDHRRETERGLLPDAYLEFAFANSRTVTSAAQNVLSEVMQVPPSQIAKWFEERNRLEEIRERDPKKAETSQITLWSSICKEYDRSNLSRPE